MAFRRMFAAYSRCLDRYPLATKAASSGVIAGGGDLLCQTLIEKRQRDDKPSRSQQLQKKESQSSQEFHWDAARTFRFVFLGATFVAPAIHFWYGYMSRLFPGSSLNSVAKRVVLDQFAFTPFFLSAWLSSFWTLEGSKGSNKMTDKALPDRLVQVVPSILVANWVFWIPAMSVNFRFVPLKFQVLFSNVLALVWNAYLSYKTSSASRQEQEKQDDPMEYPGV